MLLLLLLRTPHLHMNFDIELSLLRLILTTDNGTGNLSHKQNDKAITHEKTFGGVKFLTSTKPILVTLVLDVILKGHK